MVKNKNKNNVHKQIGKEKNPLTQRYIQNDIPAEHGYLHLYLKEKWTQFVYYSKLAWLKNQVISELFHHLGGVFDRGAILGWKKNFRPLDLGFYSYCPLTSCVCLCRALSLSLSRRVMSFVSLRSQFDITIDTERLFCVASFCLRAD